MTNKIVILDGYSANPGDLSWDEMKTLGDVVIYDRTNNDQVIGRAKGADIILTNKVNLGRKEIEQLPKLRYIGVLATGYNVVDIQAAHDNDIIVTNVPAYSTESVAQMVFAHLLTVTNRVEHYADLNRKGRWSENKDFCYWDNSLMELHGKTIGIIGLGNIGCRVADIASSFGMRVIALSRKNPKDLPNGIEKRNIDQLLSESDVLTLHCPLTDDTYQIINKETLRLMKSTAILINTGRGPLVNDIDVAQALESGSLAAYCADVMTVEPPKADNPLLGCKNAFITPHIAWASQEARKRLIDVATNNVKAFLEGVRQNVVSAY